MKIQANATRPASNAKLAESPEVRLATTNAANDLTDVFGACIDTEVIIYLRGWPGASWELTNDGVAGRPLAGRAQLAGPRTRPSGEDGVSPARPTGAGPAVRCPPGPFLSWERPLCRTTGPRSSTRNRGSHLGAHRGGDGSGGSWD